MAFAFQREGRAPRCKQRNAWTRLPNGSRAERSSFEVLLCLPTAPALPTEGSGDFGTSPFYGQLSDKPLLACTWLRGVLHRKAQGPIEKLNDENLLGVNAAR